MSYSIRRFSSDDWNGDYKGDTHFNRGAGAATGAAVGALGSAAVGIPVMGGAALYNTAANKARKVPKSLLKTKVGKVALGLTLAPTAIGATLGHTVGSVPDSIVNAYRKKERDSHDKVQGG